MGNKPHLHPHPTRRRASRVTRLFVAILIIVFIAFGTILTATGRIPAGFRWP
jgi:hypothetical protein